MRGARTIRPQAPIPLMLHRRLRAVHGFVLFSFCGCLHAQEKAPAPAAPAVAEGWHAETIQKGEAGVWYAHITKVVEAYAANDVIAADDKGRWLLLTNYSGNWTAHECNPDGQWLAPSLPADVDPRVPGRELYAGGRGGSLHQVTLRPQPFARFSVESREIGHVAGVEFHTVLAGDLGDEPGDELLAFAITGAVYRLLPEGSSGAFTLRTVGDVGGRVRDAVVTRGADGKVTMLGVSRRGDLLAMRLSAAGLQHAVLLHEDSGLGRIRSSPTSPGVHYVTRDDGVLLRVELRADGTVDRQAILASDQGLRGVAPGRFFADGREAVAVYGYGKRVQLVSRAKAGAWQVEDLYVGPQKGHWLAAGELDGRNGTDELLATGFDGEMIVIARDPGYALPGAAVPAKEKVVDKDKDGVRIVASRVPRVWARFGEQACTELSPLRYQGGFETKTLVYETLVRRDAEGRIAPGLAASWRIDDGGRAFVFTLRPGAAFHDGTPVTAAAVATHFRRWAGLPEHDWLRSNRRIRAVQATAAGELRIELEEPWALLADLCAVNPTAVRAPAAVDREGNFVKPVGSGPLAFEAVREEGRALRYRLAATEEERCVDLVRGDGDAVDALLRGEIDAVVDGWQPHVDPARVAALREDERVRVVDGPGSAMVHLGMRWSAGPLQPRAARAAVAAAIDRAALIATVAHGLADASTGWAAPSVADWPQGALPTAAAFAISAPLRFVVAHDDLPLANAIAFQLGQRGIATVVRVGQAVDETWDLRIERTHGVPYDPFTTLVSRFVTPSTVANAARPGGGAVDPALESLVLTCAADPDEAGRARHFAAIQARLDELLPIVPLFAPRRVAVVRAGLPLPALDHDLYRLPPQWLAALAR